MNREVARKRPAVVTSAYPIEVRPLPRADVLIIRNPNRTVVASEVSRRWRAGEIERDYDMGRQGEVWIARVTLKARKTWWQRNRTPIILCSIGVCLFGVFVVLLLKALAALLALALPWLMIGAAIVGAVAIFSGTHIVQKVTINK